jgi:four helix bundle protein
MSRCCDMSDFKKLAVWRKAHGLSLNIHRMAARIRGATYASLRSQVVRAGMSVPAAIVEGRGQKSDREFARYLRISINSTSEFEYHLITAGDIGVTSRNDYLSLLTQVIEVRRMLYGLLNSLDNSCGCYRNINWEPRGTSVQPPANSRELPAPERELLAARGHGRWRPGVLRLAAVGFKADG